MDVLTDIMSKAKTLAARVLDGGEVVKDSEWTALVASELRARTLAEVQAERTRVAREKELRTEYVTLQQQLAVQKQNIAECNAAARVIEDAAQAREDARMQREWTLHSQDTPYAEKMQALQRERERVEDYELSLIKAENEERISRYHVGVRLSTAEQLAQALSRQIDELKRTAQAEDVRL